jgi:hypothetical protein
VQLVSSTIFAASSLPSAFSVSSACLIARSGTPPYMEYSIIG